MRRAAGGCGPIRTGFPRTSEVGDVSWTIPTIAVIVLGFAAVSRLLDGTVITAPTGATVKLLASATLAVVLFGDAARIDLRALRDEFRVPARLLGIGLPLT